jgi:hypothetical protein
MHPRAYGGTNDYFELAISGDWKLEVIDLYVSVYFGIF